MKIKFHVYLMLFAFGHVMGLCQAERESKAMKVTLCELATTPEQYIGKMIEVRASVADNHLWIDDFEKKSACPSWMGVVVVLAENVKPKPDFTTLRNEDFKKLFKDLRAGMNVQATFEGKFEAVYTWQKNKQIWIGGLGEKQKGFGKKGQYGGRIILHRVSDILSRPIPRL